MGPSAADVAASLPAWTDSIDPLLRRTTEPDQRATGIAQVLLGQYPEAVAAACRLDGAETPAVGVCGKMVIDVPLWVACLSRPVSEWGTDEGGPIALDLGEAGRPLLGWHAAVLLGDRSWGTLLVILAPDTPPPIGDAIGRQMANLAWGLALYLRADEAERQADRLRDEQSSLTEMVTIGEAMVSLLHGLNNSLNTMMLQAAVVQLKVEEPIRQEIGLIRKEGAAVAARMRPLMQFRELRRQSRSLVDLHAVIRGFLAESAPVALDLEARLTATRSRVTAHAVDLKRLMHYLTHVAIRVAGGPALRCRLRTANHDGEMHLIIEPAEGVESPSPEAGRLFDPYNDMANPDGLLERLALDSLLRLVGATLRTYALPSGKMTTVVAWPNAA